MEEESCTEAEFDKQPSTTLKVSDGEAGGECQQETEQSQEVKQKAEAGT